MSVCGVPNLSASKIHQNCVLLFQNLVYILELNLQMCQGRSVSKEFINTLNKTIVPAQKCRCMRFYAERRLLSSGRLSVRLTEGPSIRHCFHQYFMPTHIGLIRHRQSVSTTGCAAPACDVVTSATFCYQIVGYVSGEETL